MIAYIIIESWMDSKAAFPLALNSLYCFLSMAYTWIDRKIVPLAQPDGGKEGYELCRGFWAETAPRALSRVPRLFISAQHRLYIHAGKKCSAARAQTLVVQLPGNHREGHLLLSFTPSAKTFNFANNLGRGLGVGFGFVSRKGPHVDTFNMWKCAKRCPKSYFGLSAGRGKDT